MKKALTLLLLSVCLFASGCGQAAATVPQERDTVREDVSAPAAPQEPESPEEDISTPPEEPPVPGGLPGAVPLTEEEIRQAQEALNVFPADGRENGANLELACFLTSFYDTPEALSLEEFLRYCPGGTTLEDGDAREFQAVMAYLDKEDSFTLPSDFPVPVHRYLKKDVSALLEQYAGITADDLLSTKGALYLEEYDAFYTFTSDWGPGCMSCTGGEKAGDMVCLWSDPSGESGARKVLTLQSVEGRYLIRSFQKI